MLYEIYCEMTGFNVFVCDNGEGYDNTIPREGEVLELFRSNCVPGPAKFMVDRVCWPLMVLGGPGLVSKFEDCVEGDTQTVRHAPHPVLMISPINERATHNFKEGD